MVIMSLQELIASLDKTCLPRILQVCSGVYFQGSVYELSGSEVCLSTGDLVKVIDIELLSVSCEDTSNNDKFELPINHAGEMRPSPQWLKYWSTMRASHCSVVPGWLSYTRAIL
uniref:CABIT domain-containing protein n=1 Tax=Oncorhynchus tshawytscha TaxID=74940 RepID=A0A8C8GWW3_ONCTS